MSYCLLLPPSESKKQGGDTQQSFAFPSFIQDIVATSTPRMLGVQGQTYHNAHQVNNALLSRDLQYCMPAIQRYNGVMYTAIGYETMNASAKIFFDRHAMICSGMYGIVSPTQMIARYKLPIFSALAEYRKKYVTDTIVARDPAIVINLLPVSYQKMIDRSGLRMQIVTPQFRSSTNPDRLLSHGVKGWKGSWIRALCEQGGLPGSVVSSLDGSPYLYDVFVD